LNGTGDIHLASDPAATFASDLVLGAGGDLIIDTPWVKSGGIDLGGSTLFLKPGSHLTVEAGFIQGGDLYCNGNELHCLSWTYFSYCTVYDAVFHGTVQTDTLVDFSGLTTIMDTLQNLSSGGNSHVDVLGDLINRGVIRNNNYGFTVTFSGDLVNDGEIECSYIQFDGSQTHHLSGGPAGIFDTFVFLPEFQGGTFVVDSDLYFADGVDLASGTMILSEGSSLTFSGFGSLGGGELLANGNTIHMNGSGSLGDLVIDEAVLGGLVGIGGEMVFTGLVTVLDTLQSRGYMPPEVTVEGTLRNEGHIRDGNNDLSITARGDLVNLGTMNNAEFVLDGLLDQHVAAGPGIDVPAFIIESGIIAAGYQWYRDGVALPGETGSTLVFAGLGPAEYGVYQCEGSGGEMSRLVTIAEHADPTEAPVAFAGAALEQNHPNPFNPATEIAFTLAKPGHARLTVYDAGGRLTELLIDAELDAGRHSLSWRPGDTASGVYFYRLETDAGALQRKAILIK